MAKTVTIIPPTRRQFTAEPVVNIKKRRTAGYARVSTDREEQSTSYEEQMKYYKEYIESQTNMEFVGMYSDEGISATSTAHRDGFNEMVKDALDGKIDLIITKSVSRFARNTVDSLTTVRKLKDHGIEIYFEKENIWTLDSKGELLITIMSSLAQEESRSISENTAWGKRKRFAEGVVSVSCYNLLGYDKDADGKLCVNEEQAQTVRQIYKWFLEGYTPRLIAGRLTEMNIPTPTGKKVWCPDTVRSILKNEKYKGDVLMQKYYTPDFLTKKQKKNMGELPQYYVHGNHEAIIDPDTFDMVQVEFEKRKSMDGSKYSGVNIFSSKIKCGECGGWYGSKVWHSNDKYKKIVYQCNRKYRIKHQNETPTINEEEIKRLFLRAVNKLLTGKVELIENAETMKNVLCDVSNLEKERDDLGMEMDVLVGLVNDAIEKNARIAEDQGEYQDRYEKLMDDYEKKKRQYDEFSERIAEKKVKAQQFDNFIKTLREMNGFCEQFDEDLWGSLLEYVTVYTKEDIRFTFRGGVEIKV